MNQSAKGLDKAMIEEVSYEAKQLFRNDAKECDGFIQMLTDIFINAQDKDFILIHNPGGYGCTTLDQLLVWERSVVDGISNTIETLGYNYWLTQFFRSGTGQWAHLLDMKEQIRFFFKSKSSKIEVMVAELRLLAKHLTDTRIVLIGASQGAAFSNAVMRQLGDLNQVYSIELGIFFPHMPRRVITERTLALDSNGKMPDPMAHRNLWAGFKAYITAPYRWVKYKRDGNPQKFTYCINAPGHDYNWEYPEVRQRVEEFLELHFGSNSTMGGGL